MPTEIRIPRLRWIICALLFAATTINYVDRNVLGLLAPDLQKKYIGWTEVEYGYIVLAFQCAYAIGLALTGRMIDRFGARAGYAIALCIWSLAAMSHALAVSALTFGIARFLLGIGEAANFPAAIKITAEWFPKSERAFATGIFNAGSNVGAVITPLIVPFITLHYGWRAAFILTGVLGLPWLFFWWKYYHVPEKHPKISQAELKYIQQDPPDTAERIPWARLIPQRQTWAYALGKFFTDPIWWFYLYWLPKILNDKFGLTLEGLALPIIVIYVAADIGSIGGGWLSSFLISRGWSVNRGRKTAMLVCALCVVPIVFVYWAPNVWTAVALFSLATAAHQGWSCNLYTLVSDTFPRKAVGSVIGFGGMVGSLGGMLFSYTAGHIREMTGSYMTLLLIAGGMYLLALVIIQRLVPKLDPAKV